MHWQERGGSAVSPPNQFGLGTKLLRPQAGLVDVRLTYDREGVRCDIRLTGVRELEASATALTDVPPATIYTPTTVVSV